MQQQELITKISEAGMDILEIEHLAERERLKTLRSKIINDFVKRKAEEDNIKPEDVIFCHPSQAACHIQYESLLERTFLGGACIRGEFLARLGMDITNPDNLIGKRRMQIGKVIEKQEQLYIKKAGFCEATNKKFMLYLKGRGVIISGEIDLILKEGSNALPQLRKLRLPSAVLEIKSFYGYKARKEIFGTKFIDGTAKPNHIMQTALYIEAINADPNNIMWFKEVENDLMYGYDEDTVDINTNTGIIYYVDRGDCDNIEHVIKITDNKIFVNDKDYSPKGITLDAIYGNYEILARSIRNNIIPEKTSQYQYNTDHVNFLVENKLVSANKIKEYNAGKLAIGDWQCIGENTLILSKDKKQNLQWKAIKQLDKLHKVATRHGFQNILKIKCTGKRSDMFTIKSYNLLPYNATSNHKILIGTTNNNYHKTDKVLESQKFRQVKEIIPIYKSIYTTFPIDITKNKTIITDNELKVIGNFIAEGCYHKNEDGNTYKCIFTYGTHERKHAIKIGNICLTLGSTSYKLKAVTDNRHEKPRKYLKLQVYGVAFIKWIKNYINGTYSYNKSFKTNITHLEPIRQRLLIEFMLKCDGAILNMRSSIVENYTTTSRQLALQVQMMYFRSKMISSIVTQKSMDRKMDGYPCRDAYHVRYFTKTKRHVGFIKNNIYYAKLMYIKKTKPEKVYDITTKNYHEFLTEGGIVHNCTYCKRKTACLGSTPWVANTIPSNETMQTAIDEIIRNRQHTNE